MLYGALARAEGVCETTACRNTNAMLGIVQVAKAAPATADVLSKNIENAAERAAQEAPKIADRATEQIEVRDCSTLLRQRSGKGTSPLVLGLQQ